MRHTFPGMLYASAISMMLSACSILNPASEVVPASPTILQVTATPLPFTPTGAAASALPIGQPTTSAPVISTPALSALTLNPAPTVTGLVKPLGVAHAGDGSGRLFVVEQAGRIMIVKDGVLQPEPFLDIRDRVSDDSTEKGLLGLAFHPGYASSGFFYVNYTGGERSYISRFSVSATSPDVADSTTEQVLISVRQPAPNHNGGQLAFGPDGYLYIGLGDGGAAGDLFGNGQNVGTLLGAILRIDVNAGEPYAVPVDNPFLQTPSARPGVWASGVRHPWRVSFDRLTGDLYVADVGQNLLEEVNVQPASSPGGENYGWPIMEATSCYNSDSCTAGDLILPVLEYSHDEGCSITGGYVYRGMAYPDFNGVYFYGDFCSGTIWGARQGPDGRWESTELASIGNLSSFGEDESGELYATDLGSGTLYRLAP